MKREEEEGEEEDEDSQRRDKNNNNNNNQIVESMISICNRGSGQMGHIYIWKDQKIVIVILGWPSLIKSFPTKPSKPFSVFSLSSPSPSFSFLSFPMPKIHSHARIYLYLKLNRKQLAMGDNGVGSGFTTRNRSLFTAQMSKFHEFQFFFFIYKKKSCNLDPLRV